MAVGDAYEGAAVWYMVFVSSSGRRGIREVLLEPVVWLRARGGLVGVGGARRVGGPCPGARARKKGTSERGGTADRTR